MALNNNESDFCARSLHRKLASIVKMVTRVSRVTVLTAVFAFGAMFAEADDFSAQSAVVRLGVPLLSGMQSCVPTFQDGFSKGSQCMAGWAVNELLLDTATRLASKQGQALFGEHFRIVNSMSYSPFESRLSGGLDVVLPLASSTLPGTTPSDLGAFFLQQGVTRWVDDHGLGRNDFRFGAVSRFELPEESMAPGVLGVSAFVQQSLEFQHTRLVAGGDYAGKWGRGSLNLFMPTTGWQSNYKGHEERALAGIELGLKLDLTTTLSMSTAIGQWEELDGSGGWSTNGRMAVGWRPHPWLEVGIAWNGLGTLNDSKAIRVGFSIPLGNTRKASQWEGLGLVGGSPEPSVLDPWAPVENIGVIQVARHESASDYLVSGARVRFLQESASSGDQIGIEVLLPTATPRYLSLVVTLEPGTGDNPAVPGVDYFDEPIPVTIRAGTSSAVVTVQLPLNAELNENRSLRATVAFAS